jgi:hypothetical protein
MNTCHRWPGKWVPTYYVTVDRRVMHEFGEAVYERYKDIPKFIPRPNLNKWQGENFYRFLHRPGEMNDNAKRADALTDEGIAYRNVMHVAIQLAWHMGFTKFLIVGMQHRPHKAQLHFWGTDHGMVSMHYPDWLEGYRYFADRIDLVNISTDTWVSEDVLPRDDWRKYEDKNARVFPGYEPTEPGN